MDDVALSNVLLFDDDRILSLTDWHWKPQSFSSVNPSSYISKGWQEISEAPGKKSKHGASNESNELKNHTRK